MGIALQPTGSWVELVVTGGTPDQTVRLAPRPWPDPPTYYGGKKRGTILRLGDVIRALSDRAGSPSVASFSFDVFDRDGSLRALLEAVTYLTTADLTFYLASAQAHDLAYLPDPRVGFRGQVVTPAPRPGRAFTISAESRMGTRFGPFDFDSPVLKRKFETTDFPNLPRDNVGKAVPFGWGEFSDEGTVSQVPGPGVSPFDVAKGMIIPVATGYLTGTPTGPPKLLPPTNFQIVVHGSGPTKYARLAVTFANANGETTPAILDIPAYPAHPGPFPGTPTHWASWTWDDPNAPPVSHGFGYIDDFDGTGWHQLDGMYLTYTDDGDDSHDKGPGGQNPPSVNTAVIGATASTSTARFYCLSANPGKIISIYKSDGNNPPAYTPVTATDIGTLFDLGPLDEGYVYTAPSGREYFGFLAQGPAADAHDNGTMPFRVNYCGWHDGSDLLIDRAAYVYQDVIVQLQGNNGQGWQGGARLTIPFWGSAPTVPILQSTTFDAVQALTVTEMGTTYGALAAVYLDSFETTWRTFIEGMNRTFQFDEGENHHGQIVIHAIPLSVNPATGVLLREYIDIRRVTDAGEPHPDEIEDSINYQYDWSPADQAFRSGLIPYAVAPGYGGVKRERPGSLDLLYTRDPATATWSSAKYVSLRSVAARYPALVCKFRKALAIELGDQIRVQHSDLGAGTFILYCREQRASVTRGEVELRGQLRAIA